MVKTFEPLGLTVTMETALNATCVGAAWLTQLACHPSLSSRHPTVAPPPLVQHRHSRRLLGRPAGPPGGQHRSYAGGLLLRACLC